MKRCELCELPIDTKDFEHLSDRKEYREEGNVFVAHKTCTIAYRNVQVLEESGDLQLVRIPSLL